MAVGVAVASADDVRRYRHVRGRVVEVTTDGADEHINALSHKYLGEDYPGFGGDVTRVKLVIEADRIGAPMR